MTLESRADKMTNVLFREENLDLLQKGFNALYDLWREVGASHDSENSLTARDVQAKLDELVKERWKHVEDIFQHSSFQGTKKKLSTQDEHVPAKLFAELVHATDAAFSGLRTRVEELYDTDRKRKDEISRALAESTKLQQDLTQARWKLNQATTDYNNLKGQVSGLEELNTSKSEQIVQLQRDSNVQLWQREKARILERAGVGNDGQQEIIAQLESEKQLLKERLKDVETVVKRMKVESGLSVSRLTVMKELEEEKKYSFLLEKDLRKIDEELYNHQKLIIGVMEGLRYSVERWLKCHIETPTKSKIEDLEKLEMLLAEGRSAAANAKFDTFAERLPLEFQAKDRDIVQVIVRKLSHKVNGRTAPIPERNISQEPITKTVSKNGTTKVLGVSSDLKKSSVSLSKNPELVDKVTGEVKMMNVLRKFPYYLKEDIEKLWNQFKLYDRNSDGSLDLSEVMAAITGMFNDNFTATQIREAMIEVDEDESEDLDFYEFVCVANLLRERAGRADVFRTMNTLGRSGRRMSKVCAVM